MDKIAGVRTNLAGNLGGTLTMGTEPLRKISGGEKKTKHMNPTGF